MTTTNLKTINHYYGEFVKRIEIPNAIEITSNEIKKLINEFVIEKKDNNEETDKRFEYVVKKITKTINLWDPNKVTWKNNNKKNYRTIQETQDIQKQVSKTIDLLIENKNVYLIKATRSEVNKVFHEIDKNLFDLNKAINPHEIVIEEDRGVINTEKPKSKAVNAVLLTVGILAFLVSTAFFVLFICGILAIAVYVVPIVLAMAIGLTIAVYNGARLMGK